MKKNTGILLAFLCLFSVCMVFSGTLFWDDGEIVRGTKINTAFTEKLDITGGAVAFVTGVGYVQLTPTAGFATGSKSIGTVYQNATGTIIYLSTGTTWLALLATTTFNW